MYNIIFNTFLSKYVTLIYSCSKYVTNAIAVARLGYVLPN